MTAIFFLLVIVVSVWTIIHFIDQSKAKADRTAKRESTEDAAVFIGEQNPFPAASTPPIEKPLPQSTFVPEEPKLHDSFALSDESEMKVE